MRRWLAACVLVGCWRDPPPVVPVAHDDPPAAAEPPPRVARRGPEPGSLDDTIAKMSEFRDQMCACSDKACADLVTDDMTKWAQQMAKSAGSLKQPKLSDAQMKDMQQVTEEFTKCAVKALT